MKSPYYSVAEAARQLVVSENTIRRWLDTGRLGGFVNPINHRRWISPKSVAMLRGQVTAVKEQEQWEN